MYYGKVSAKFLLNFANETIDWWHGSLINDFIKIPQDKVYASIEGVYSGPQWLGIAVEHSNGGVV